MELLAGFSAILSTLAVIGIFRPFKFAPKLTRRHYAIAAVVAFSVFLFSAPTPPPSAPEEKRSASESAPKDENTFADTGKQFTWNERGQDTVRSKLKDPDSAEFRFAVAAEELVNLIRLANGPVRPLAHLPPSRN